MRSFYAIRCWAICWLFLNTGCAWLHNLSHPVPPPGADSLPESSSDEEAGVNDLRNRLKNFRVALAAKHFSEADHALSRAEEGVKVSSVVTRSHPDFDDLADAVRASRPRLEAAIEDDRIARRNAAIDDLVHRGQVAMGRIDVVFEELAAHSPEAEDMQNINELVKLVSDLQREGEPYMQERRYTQHAQKRDALAARLAGMRVRVQRQFQTRQAVMPAITAGIVAANDAKAATTDDARINLYQEVSKNFALCAASLESMTTQAGYDPSLVIETKLGKLTAQQTQSACTSTSRQAAGRVHHLVWQQRVQTLAAALQAGQDAIGQASEAAVKEVGHQKIIVTLKTCQEDPSIDATAAGFDNQAHFRSPFGNVTVPQLIARCSQDIPLHTAATVRLHWLVQAETISKRLDQVQSQLTQAGHAESPTRQSAAWSAAVGGLKECTEQATSLLQLTGADPKHMFGSPWGAMTLSQVGTRCNQEREHAEKNLATALKHAEAQAFLSDCHNDEIAVVQREGVPSHIDTITGGRVFVYAPQDGHGTTSRFAFDAQGHRLDLSVRYKAQVEELVGQINALLPQAHAGGRDAQQAIAALTPILEKCQTGTVTEHAPGFESAMLFETPFGRLNGTKLSRACDHELTHERDQTTRLAWQVRLQSLADRATAAEQELRDTPQAVDPNEQVSHAAAAQGGMLECRERAHALAHAEGADRAYKTQTPWGKQTVDDMAKSCAKMMPEAERVLARAEARKKLADFVGTCQGDERDVVERNGMPTHIEPKGPGRVFIYGKKRIAFDASGHRTDEKQLQDK